MLGGMFSFLCRMIYYFVDRLTSLNHRRTYEEKPCTRPQSCATPQQPTMCEQNWLRPISRITIRELWLWSLLWLLLLQLLYCTFRVHKNNSLTLLKLYNGMKTILRMILQKSKSSNYFLLLVDSRKIDEVLLIWTQRNWLS